MNVRLRTCRRTWYGTSRGTCHYTCRRMCRLLVQSVLMPKIILVRVELGVVVGIAAWCSSRNSRNRRQWIGRETCRETWRGTSGGRYMRVRPPRVLIVRVGLRVGL
jgi:hypothetical protein